MSPPSTQGGAPAWRRTRVLAFSRLPIDVGWHGDHPWITTDHAVAFLTAQLRPARQVRLPGPGLCASSTELGPVVGCGTQLLRVRPEGLPEVLAEADVPVFAISTSATRIAASFEDGVVVAGRLGEDGVALHALLDGGGSAPLVSVVGDTVVMADTRGTLVVKPPDGEPWSAEVPRAEAQLSRLGREDGDTVLVGTGPTESTYLEPTVAALHLPTGRFKANMRLWGDAAWWPYAGVMAVDSKHDVRAVGMAVVPPEDAPFGFLELRHARTGHAVPIDSGHRRLNGPISSLAFRADGRALLVGRFDPASVELWEPVD